MLDSILDEGNWSGTPPRRNAAARLPHSPLLAANGSGEQPRAWRRGNMGDRAARRFREIFWADLYFHFLLDFHFLLG